MSKYFKFFLTGTLLTLFLTWNIAVAHPEYREELVKAVFQDIKLVVNGKLVELPVEPFQVEAGYFMVPVRTIGELLGCLVEWDPEAKVVYVNKITDNSNPEQVKTVPEYVENLPVLRNVGPFFQLKSRNMAIAGNTFEHGLVVELAKSKEEQKEPEKTSLSAETVIDLKGAYSWLEGSLGVEDETRNSRGGYRLRIFGDGVLLYESREIKPAEYPVQIKVNVEKVHLLTFHVYWLEAGIGEYDRLWAALAGFQVY